MTRYVFSSGSSNKFWEGRVEGSTLTVRFGRVGSAGQERSKKLTTPARAAAELAKKVAEKTRGGYRPEKKAAEKKAAEKKAAEKKAAEKKGTARATMRGAALPPSKDAKVAPMSLTRRETVLADGSPDAVFEFMDSRDAVIVDWRAFFDEITDDFARHLPKAFLALEETKGLVTLRTKHGTAKVALTGKPPFGLDVAEAIADILPPTFEAHAFAESLESDTHCYLVRRSAWWDAFRASYPARYRTIFAKPRFPKRFVVEPVAASPKTSRRR